MRWIVLTVSLWAAAPLAAQESQGRDLMAEALRLFMQGFMAEMEPAMNRDGNYRITDHARQQLATRWSETVLRPTQFDHIQVPNTAPLVGYDSSTSGWFVEVPNSPMVAIVNDGIVVTFLSADAARAKIALHGYGPDDFVRE